MPNISFSEPATAVSASSSTQLACHSRKLHRMLRQLDRKQGKALGRTVIGRSMQRRRYHEFIRFLNTIEAQVPE